MQSTEKETELQYRKIERQAVLLLNELSHYISERFSDYAYAKSVDEDNIHAVLDQLRAEPAAIEAPAETGLFAAVKTVATSVTKTLSKLVFTETPFHRLPHLRYFAERAKQLQECTSILAKLAQESFKSDVQGGQDFSTQSQVLTDLLKELFETSEFLTQHDYSKKISRKIAGQDIEIPGMKGGLDGSKLATKVTDILGTDTQAKFEDLTTTIKRNDELYKEKRKEAHEAVLRETQSAEQRTRAAADAEKKQLEHTHRQELAKKDDTIKLVVSAATKKTAELRETSSALAEKEAALTEAEQQRAEAVQQRAEAVMSKAKLCEERSMFAEQIKGLSRLGDDGLNALHSAILKGDLARVKVLLEAGVNANITTKKLLSPLSLTLLDTKGDLKSELTATTFGILALLLEHSADPNKFIQDQRTFLHLLAFRKNKQAYVLRTKPNLACIESLLLHGARLDIGEVVSENFTQLISDKDNQSPLAKLLRTFNIYSRAQLVELYKSEHALRTSFESLTARSANSVSAVAQLAAIKPYFDRYHCVFELFLDSTYANRLRCADEIGLISKERRASDFTSLSKCIMTMQEKVTALKKPSTAKQFESVEEETATYSAISLMAQSLLKCIEKIDNMHTVRYQPSETQFWALTPLENVLIDKNLKEAKVKFAEDLAEEATAATKQRLVK